MYPRQRVGKVGKTVTIRLCAKKVCSVVYNYFVSYLRFLGVGLCMQQNRQEIGCEDVFLASTPDRFRY